MVCCSWCCAGGIDVGCGVISYGGVTCVTAIDGGNSVSGHGSIVIGIIVVGFGGCGVVGSGSIVIGIAGCGVVGCGVIFGCGSTVIGVGFDTVRIVIGIIVGGGCGVVLVVGIIDIGIIVDGGCCVGVAGGGSIIIGVITVVGYDVLGGCGVVSIVMGVIVVG